jgi:cytochrome c biogenesis protein ResB
MAPAGKPLQGTSDFPTTGYVLDMTFFPDRGGRSPYPVNPSLDVRFLKGKREVARAALKPGEDTLVGRDRFRFEEVRTWSGLILAENRFIPLVYAGFLMSTAGLFMMFFFVPQEILVSRTVEKDGTLTIAVAVKTRMGNHALSADVVEHIKESLGREETKG